MTDTSEKIDYSETLYLPQTDFPMRAGLPEKRAADWSSAGRSMDLYKRLREKRRGPREVRAA